MFVPMRVNGDSLEPRLPALFAEAQAAQQDAYAAGRLAAASPGWDGLYANALRQANDCWRAFFRAATGRWN